MPPHNNSQLEGRGYWERSLCNGVDSNLSIQDLAIDLITNGTNNVSRAAVVAGQKYVWNRKYHLFLKLCSYIYLF